MYINETIYLWFRIVDTHHGNGKSFSSILKGKYCGKYMDQ